MKWDWNKVIFTVYIPAVIAVFTVVKECMESSNKLSLQEKAQHHEIRQKYLELALRPSANSFEQERVFSFLTKVDDDTVLSHWAKEGHDELLKLNKSKIIKDSLSLLANSKNMDSNQRIMKMIDSLKKEIAIKSKMINVDGERSPLILDAGLGAEYLRCKEGTIRGISGIDSLKSCLKSEKEADKIFRIWDKGRKWSWVTKREKLFSDLPFEDISMEDEKTETICECDKK